VTSKIAFLVVAAAVAALTLTPLAASGDDDQKGVYVGMHLHFTGPDSSAGTFVVSGAVEDSGTSDVRHLALVPIGNGTTARLSGEQTFSGSRGTILTRFEGRAFPLSSPHQVGRGTFEIVSGTGAYSNLRGGGRFLIVVDAISNELDGTEAGSVQ